MTAKSTDEDVSTAKQEMAAFEQRMEQLVQLHKKGLLDALIDQKYKGIQTAPQRAPVVREKKVKPLTAKQVGKALREIVEKDDADALVLLHEQNPTHFERWGVPAPAVSAGREWLWPVCVKRGAFACMKKLLESGFDPVQELSQHWAQQSVQQWVQTLEGRCSESVDPQYHSGKSVEKLRVSLEKYAQKAKGLLEESLKKQGAEQGMLWLDANGKLHVNEVSGARQVSALLWTLNEKTILEQLGLDDWISQDERWVGVGKSEQTIVAGQNSDESDAQHKAAQYEQVWKLWAPKIPKPLLELTLVSIRDGSPYGLMALWEQLGHPQGSLNVMQRILLELDHKNAYTIKPEWESIGMRKVKGLDIKCLALSVMQEQVAQMLNGWQHSAVQAHKYLDWIQVQLEAVQKVRLEQERFEANSPSALVTKPVLDLCGDDDAWWCNTKTNSDIHALKNAGGYVQQLEQWALYLSEWQRVSGQQDVSIWQCMPARQLGQRLVQSALKKSEDVGYEERLVQLLVQAHKLGWSMQELKMSAQIDDEVEYGFWADAEKIKSMRISIPIYALLVDKKVLAKVLWSDEQIREQVLSDRESVYQLSHMVPEKSIEVLQKWGVAVERLVDEATGNNVFHNWFEVQANAYNGFEQIKKYPQLMWQENKKAKVPLDLMELNEKQARQWAQLKASKIKQALTTTVTTSKKDQDGQLIEVQKKVLAGGRRKSKSGFKKAL